MLVYILVSVKKKTKKLRAIRKGFCDKEKKRGRRWRILCVWRLLVYIYVNY